MDYECLIGSPKSIRGPTAVSGHEFKVRPLELLYSAWEEWAELYLPEVKFCEVNMTKWEEGKKGNMQGSERPWNLNCMKKE